jgi:hypothetical protein
VKGYESVNLGMKACKQEPSLWNNILAKEFLGKFVS